jgi:hypothetical protein
MPSMMLLLVLRLLRLQLVPLLARNNPARPSRRRRTSM